MEKQSLKNEVISTLQSYGVEDSLELIRKIEEIKKTSQDSQVSEELDVYINLLKFVAFATLPEYEQLQLFKNHLIKALRVGIDIQNRFTIKIHLTPATLWPETAQTFVEAMLKNEERVGRNQIIIQGERNSIIQTTANWLRDYNRIYGTDKHERIIPHRYISESTNAQRMKPDERAILLKLLELYENIKFPSQKQIEKALEKVSREEGISFDEEKDDNLITGIQKTMNTQDIVSEDINSILGKYPKVGEQIIGKKPIKTIQADQWIKPTINNWLADYRSYAGAGPHDTKERSDYLLRSPNTQELDTKDREKLALILRSYDESYILKYSTQRQEIVF